MKYVYLCLLLSLFVLSCNHTNSYNNQSTDTPKKKTVQREVLSQVDYNRVFENKIIDGIPIKLLNIGNLKVPTGKIVVCDPIVLPNIEPLNKTVKPGVFPVKIYIAQTEKSGDRYAIAKLEFSSMKADKWVLALHDSDDTSQLKDPDDFLGFPVDAGMGGFFDYKAGIEYRKFTDEFEKNKPGGNIYDDYLAAEFKKNAKNPKDDGDWINLKIPNSDLNITMFHSGYGDGSYPAYWGMTKNNKIVSLIIDFIVLPLYKK